MAVTLMDQIQGRILTGTMCNGSKVIISRYHDRDSFRKVILTTEFVEDGEDSVLVNRLVVGVQQKIGRELRLLIRGDHPHR